MKKSRHEVILTSGLRSCQWDFNGNPRQGHYSDRVGCLVDIVAVVEHWCAYCPYSSQLHARCGVRHWSCHIPGALRYPTEDRGHW